MKSSPYIGVTGFKTEYEVCAVGELFTKYLYPESGYTAMFGFVCSSKRLLDIDKEGETSPALKNLEHLAATVPKGLLPMVHYFCTDGERLVDEIEQVFRINDIYERGSCRAVQLNSAWPELNEVEKIKQIFPDLTIVLQFPRVATEGKTAENVGAVAKTYAGLIDYALIDPSGGEGIDFELERNIELMLAVGEALPEVRMGIAGGLSGENVYCRYLSVAKKTRDFCIDTQKNVRKEYVDERASQIIDVWKSRISTEKVEEYITHALLAIARVSKQ